MRDRTFRGVTLVLDENLSGHRILAGLRAEGIPVKPQTDFLHRGASDEQVLKSLASHPTCFLISKDSDFHRKDAVKTALIQYGIGAFVITAHKNKTAADVRARSLTAIARRPRNIFAENELERISVVAFFATTGTDGISPLDTQAQMCYNLI